MDYSWGIVPIMVYAIPGEWKVNDRDHTEQGTQYYKEE